MRTVIITGASDGIGAAAAQQLASSDIRLILVGRSPEKTRKVAEALGAEHRSADFESLEQVRELGRKIKQSCARIDVLAHNAGGLFPGPHRTEDGFERTFQINHLAPYLLTNILIDQLLESRASVINTSSIAAKIYGRLDLDDLQSCKNFRSNRAYGNAKLANILFTKALHARFHEQGLSAVAFHPGVVATNFAADSTNYFRWIYHGLVARFLTTSTEGGRRLSHFITSAPGTTWVSGDFYGSNLKPARTNPAAYESSIVQEHWRQSAAMLDVEW